MIAAWRILPDGKSTHPLHLDLVGTAIIMGALFLLAFPLVQGRELGWPLWTFFMMAASIPALAFFAWYETRKMARDGSPLVVPQLFHERAFLVGMIVNLIFEMGLVGYFLTSTLLLQAGLGYSVLHAGLTGIPFSIGVGFSIGFLGQQMIPRFGRYLMAIGAVILGLGMVGIAWTATHYGVATHSWQLAPSLLMGGLGMGMVMAPLFAVVLSGVDIKHAGSASGILNAVQQVGGAIGVALIGVIFFGQLTHQADAKVASVVPELRADLTAAHVPGAAQDQIVQGFKVCFHDRATAKDSSVVPASCQQTAGAQPQVPAATAKAIENAVTKAAKTANQRNFTSAFSWGVVSALGLLILTSILSFFLPKRITPEAQEVVA
jgi:hypothetical protein